MKKKSIIVICGVLAILIAVAGVVLLLLIQKDELPEENDCVWSNWTTEDSGEYGKKTSFKRICLECGEEQEYKVEPCSHLTYKYDNDKNYIVTGANECDCEFLYILSKAPDGTSVVNIGATAFVGNTTHSFVYIESGIKVIEESAFVSCEKLLSVTLPEKLERLDEVVFFECKNLYTVNIPEGINELREYTFGGCESLRLPELPQSVEKIHEGCFSRCLSFIDVKLPDCVRFIGKRTFSGCINLKSLVMEGVEGELLEETFANCSSLTEFSVPDGVNAIYSAAFANCSALEKLYIPSSVTVLEYEEGESPFMNCNEKLTVYCQAEEAHENWLEGYDICKYIYNEDGEKVSVRLKFVFGAEF